MEQWVHFILCIFSVFSLIPLKGGCDSPEEAALACSQNANCSMCIQTAGCIWCSKEITLNDSLPIRCVLADASRPAESWCPGGHVVELQSDLTVVIDKELGKFDGELVQIRPQYVKLKVRVGEPINLNFQYAQAEDYPVDLYYLMDLSGSMEDDKDKLSALGDQLSTVMREITSNFRLGFGSFVDKVAAPFVSTIKAHLNKPCSRDKLCDPPYSFKNHMSLSNETKKFSKMVKQARISGNLDVPEGGFDAIMQSMVCKEEIGWRQKARHLLVFSTDAMFHLAGDGKLAGIIRPHDGQCHMTNGEYDLAASLEYDYPSIAQLNQKAQEQNINLIFAVPKNLELLYKSLANEIKGATFGALSKDSANVVELVRSVYDKLVDGVTVGNGNNEFVEIRYFSRCLNQSEPLTETRECHGLHAKTIVDFTAEIRVLKCPTEPAQRIQYVEIKPLSLNESLVVELEIICDCPCEQLGDTGYKENASECNGGDSKCGVCTCKDGNVGRYCECQRDSTNSYEDQSSCKGPDNSSVICSGLGACKCGQCECKTRRNPAEMIYGKLCECNNYSCTRRGDEVCSGSLQGICRCGKCECQPGWIGEACECRNYNDSCIAPGSKEVCSGKGQCVCGSCKCLDPKHRGKYCEECSSCPGQRCEELRFCVGCSLDEHKSKECAHCNAKNYQIELVDKFTDEDVNEEEHKCWGPDEAGCTFVFKYKYEDAGKEFKIKALKTKECGTPINILGLIFGITGSTVILGLLLLLIWKVLTSLHDRREYIKFEKERAMAKWDRGDNPLYKPSTSTFSNPTFGND